MKFANEMSVLVASAVLAGCLHAQEPEESKNIVIGVEHEAIPEESIDVARETEIASVEVEHVAIPEEADVRPLGDARARRTQDEDEKKAAKKRLLEWIESMRKGVESGELKADRIDALMKFWRRLDPKSNRLSRERTRPDSSSSTLRRRYERALENEAALEERLDALRADERRAADLESSLLDARKLLENGLNREMDGIADISLDAVRKAYRRSLDAKRAGDDVERDVLRAERKSREDYHKQLERARELREDADRRAADRRDIDRDALRERLLEERRKNDVARLHFEKSREVERADRSARRRYMDALESSVDLKMDFVESGRGEVGRERQRSIRKEELRDMVADLEAEMKDLKAMLAKIRRLVRQKSRSGGAK